MKTKTAFLSSILVALAMSAHCASAQDSEVDQDATTAEASAEAAAEASSDTTSKVTIEINGKKVEADGSGGTITIRTDGEEIEIDTDGDGEAEERIDRREPQASGVGWLGVKTSELSAELAAQLDLDGGAVIEIVVPGSPADEAGLQEHDVITAVGDAKIASPEDLATKIRSMEPGSKVGISVVRKAQPKALTAKLGDRPQMPEPKPLDLEDFQFDADADFDEIRKKIEQMQREMLKGMRMPDIPDLDGIEDIVRMSSKTTCFSDGDGSITITSKDGVTQIEARDSEGKLIYEGPAETEDDRKKLPPKVLEKLEKFEAMNLKMDLRKFKDKRLPPAVDPPKLKPVKPKQPTATRHGSSEAA